MQCCVEDCGRAAMYKGLQLCQMHYFRQRRTGTKAKRPTNRQMRVLTPNGYVRLFEPGHPLADKGGYVFEHRHVMWGVIGAGCRDCELCSKHETWLTCHVDHIDENRQNNGRSNLRILCRGCNVKRGFTQESHANRTEIGLIEFEGERKTATQWGLDARIAVCGATVMRRKRSGMSDFEALFGRKLTHNGSKPLPSPRKTNHKHERSNAVAITVEGYTLTASEWSREPGVTVSVRSIVNRIREGLDPIEAVFARPGKKPLQIEDLKAMTAEYRAKTRELKGRESA